MAKMNPETPTSPDDESEGAVPLLQPAPRATLLQRLRNDLLAGLVIVMPVIITGYLAWTFVNLVDETIYPLIPERYRPETYLPIRIPGLGLIAFIISVTVIGALARNIIGRTLIRWSEQLLHRMPIVRSIYDAIKQIAKTALQDSSSSFRQVCLVEYPRRGIWAIGFVTAQTGGVVASAVPEESMVSIFLPTTPNPTSGFLLFVPEKDIILLDIEVEQAAKLVISAGLIEPEAK